MGRYSSECAEVSVVTVSVATGECTARCWLRLALVLNCWSQSAHVRQSSCVILTCVRRLLL